MIFYEYLIKALEVFFLSLCLFPHFSFLWFFPTDEQQSLIQRYDCIAFNWREIWNTELWLFSLLFWIAEKQFYIFILTVQDLCLQKQLWIFNREKERRKWRVSWWRKKTNLGYDLLIANSPYLYSFVFDPILSLHFIS